LAGVPIEEGEGVWRATRLLFHSAAEAVTGDSSGQGGFAGVELPRVVPGPATPNTIVAEIAGKVGSSPSHWVGTGLLPPLNGASLGLQGHGTLWTSLHGNGLWYLWKKDGSTTTAVAQGVAPVFLPFDANRMRVEYDRNVGQAQVWINDVRVVTNLYVGTLPGSSLASAGVQLGPAASETTTVDHFALYYRSGLTTATSAVGDEFAPLGFAERAPGMSLDRAWASEGDARWSSYGVQFAGSGAVAIPSGSRGGAWLPFAPRNLNGADELFIEGALALRVAEEVALGFFRSAPGRGAQFPASGPVSGGDPVQVGQGPWELWWRLKWDGSWTLTSRVGGDLASGTIAGFDPAVSLWVRLETAGPTYVLYLGSKVAASGGLPATPMVSAVGFDVQDLEVGYPPGASGSFEMDVFRAGVNGGAN